MAAPENTPSDPNLPQFGCNEVRSQQFDAVTMNSYVVSPEISSEVEGVLRLMTPAQKARQMLGVDGSTKNYRDLWRNPDVEVPGVGVIRGFRYRDSGRGVNLDAGQRNRPEDGKDYSTAYPTPSLRAASWDLDLEMRVGEAIGDEVAASSNNALLAPCMNIVRHPYWGRIQETYGEDTYHVGRMATAFTVGVQRHVLACAKHFAANNVEKGRSEYNAVMTEQTLREMYGRHFEMVVQDGGVGCVMASHNLINGVESTQNEHLLRGILKAPLERGGMGFGGFVITDWWAMPGGESVPDAATAQAVTVDALHAGTDMEMPWTLHYDETTLANADPTLVEVAARRILTQKYRFGTALTTDPWSMQASSSTLTEGSLAPNEAHEALAEEAAVKSIVLLSNGLDPTAPVLPLAGETTIAVVGPDQPFHQIGTSVPRSCDVWDMVGLEQAVMAPPIRDCTFRFATDPALGDRGSSRVNGDPARSFGPFAGLQAAAGAGRTVTSGNSVDATEDADAVVVVVGYTPGDEGEEFPIETGGDRSSLDLPPGHAELVSSVLDLNKPTIIIIESGSIVNLPWLEHANENQATIWAGYPGQRGGLALGKLIFGQANFSGKMPLAWPTQTQLPAFKDSDTETTMDYFFGYRHFDRQQYVQGTPVDLVFPFGHGLSYSTFEYSNLSVPCVSAAKDAVFNVSVDITNTSTVDGDEIAMLFVKPPPRAAGSTGERPWKQLGSFARVSVPAGTTATAQLPLRIADLRRWEGDEDGSWVVDSGDYTISIGKNAADAETTNVVSTLTVEGD